MPKSSKADPNLVNLNATRKGLIFCKQCLDKEVVAASSVLSSIAEAGGKASLPGTVKLPEFKLWYAAVKTVFGKSKQKQPNIPFGGLCAIAKVADVLGDSHEWMEKTMDSLVELLNFDSWACVPEELLYDDVSEDYPEEANEIQALNNRMVADDHQFRDNCSVASIKAAAAGLLSLPDHLQQDIFIRSNRIRRGAYHYECPFSYFLLGVFSRVPALARNLMAALAPEGTLTLGLSPYWYRCFSAVGSMPATPPLLNALKVADQGGHLGDPAVEEAPGWPGFLSHALQKQPGITRLSLEPCCVRDPVDMGELAESAPRMSSIHSLDLSNGSYAMYYPPATTLWCQHLRTLLESSPNLRLLKLAILLHEEPGGKQQKRKFGAAAPPAVPEKLDLDMLHVMFPPASGLTSLSITARCGDCDEPLMAPSAISMPQLLELDLYDDNSSPSGSAWPLLFLSSLKAPLKRLSMTLAARHFRPDEGSRNSDARADCGTCLGRLTSLQTLVIYCIPLGSEQQTSALMSNITKLPQLSELKIIMLPGGMRREVPEYVASVTVNALSARQVPQLSKVTFKVDLSWSSSTLKSLTQAFCGLPALKQLDLVSSTAWDAPSATDSAPATASVQESLQAICEQHDVAVTFTGPERKQRRV